MTAPQPPDSHPQPPYYEPFEEDSFDFKRYLSLFISNWYWFSVSLFISLSISYGINRWSAKVYTVSSTLLIKNDQSSTISDIFPGSDGFKNQQNLKNEIGILRSFDLNNRVMQELPDFYIDYVKVGKRGIAEMRMYKDCPFEVVYAHLENQLIGQKVYIKILSENEYRIEINNSRNIDKVIAFGDEFREAGFDFKVIPREGKEFQYDPDESNRYYFYFRNPAELANTYRSKLSVTPVDEEASLVTLSTSGLVKEQETDYLNKLMDVYLAFGLEYKNETASKTLEFIEEQLGTISDSLRDAEGVLENFRLTNKLIDISSEGAAIKEKLKQIDDKLTTLQLQENYFIYLKDYIESKTENDDIVAPSVMNIIDPTLTKLVDELSKLQKEKKKYELNLDESLDPLRLIDENIATTRSAISENIRSSLQNIERSKADILKESDLAEKDIRRLPSTERQMINIQRKFDINNTVYTFLLEKRAEAGIARASNVPDNRIIDKAGFYNAYQIKPKEKKNTRMAFLFGLLVPLLGIILLDYLNNKVIDKNDIEKRTSAPVLGYISHNSLKTEIPVVENPGSTLSESFRSVRTILKYFLKDNECPVLSITSTISSEGKTFVSANLAAILSMSGKRVLLAGLDLRKPRIHKIFGLKNDIGITSYLISEEKFENVIIKTNIENLWYAPSGPVPPNPAELIESSAMADFIKKAKKMFDYIIIDTPPVAIVTDALLVSSFTDLYLFVVRQRYTFKNTIGLIDELHKSGNIKSIGIVINDISLSGFYGYGLRYGYARGYGYNYGYSYYNQYGKYGYSESSKGYYKED